MVVTRIYPEKNPGVESIVFSLIPAHNPDILTQTLIELAAEHIISILPNMVKDEAAKRVAYINRVASAIENVTANLSIVEIYVEDRDRLDYDNKPVTYLFGPNYDVIGIELRDRSGKTTAKVTLYAKDTNYNPKRALEISRKIYMILGIRLVTNPDQIRNLF